MSLKNVLSILGAMSLAIPCSYSQPRPAGGVLKGTVRDATLKLPIGGAKVQVLNASGTVVSTSITNKNGTYLVSGLVLGQSVNAPYSAAGYAPDPWSRPLKVASEITQDVSLLCDCKDTAYWKEWADIQKALAENLGKDPSSKAQFLDESWSALGYIGISAEARGSAARHLVTVEPITRKFSAISDFATTDPMVLRTTEAQLRAKLHGGALEKPFSVSSEIVGEIVAVEVRKQSKVGDNDVTLTLGKLDAALGPETKKHTLDIFGKDANMKDVADRVVLVNK